MQRHPIASFRTLVVGIAICSWFASAGAATDNDTPARSHSVAEALHGPSAVPSMPVSHGRWRAYAQDSDVIAPSGEQVAFAPVPRSRWICVPNYGCSYFCFPE